MMEEIKKKRLTEKQNGIEANGKKEWWQDVVKAQMNENIMCYKTKV